MSDIIHLLPDHIANQIAAGEVIQRPASVVKELMENSIDAGAGMIVVNIKDAGRTLIQVIDDGKGMSETDARMAFERHATSKISSVNDLFSLRTMGFRGEALASIAAVAQVELRTRAKGGEIGVCLSISASTLDTVTPDACNEGSIFSVKNLFYNVPARRKFLKSNETEFRHILTEFERVALVHPDISFTLRHNDAVVYELLTCGLRQRIVDIFGKNVNQKLLSVDADTSLIHVRGFAGRVDSVKKRGLQYFFVNGRYMRHPYFHKAVMQAYEQMIPTGEMPDYFIYFDVDPSTIDVNIHPTKTEIKFENEHPIWQIIFSAVRETLAKSNSVPSIDFDVKSVIDIPIYNPSHEASANMRPPELTLDKAYNPFRETGGHRFPDEWKTLYEGFESERNAVLLPNENSRDEKKQPNPELPAVGTYSENDTISVLSSGEDDGEIFANVSNPCFQYKNRYIITPLKSGLVIIDQHRAHVRILYERYVNNIIRRSAVSQKLLFPEIIEFTASESSLLSSLADEIRFLGFDLVPMGGNSYAVHGAPADVSRTNPSKLVKDIVAAAMDSGVSEADKKIERMALSLAKATAIPAGKILSSDEMETIVASLFVIPSNGMTPDGLSVLTIITDEELTKRI
ncbi:MAG: DNA mismatch repair endonuclease MutL [Tannerella sp.]|jgi:DNA mismatch repair protein MutL|nr:DNA mismatch repair endonuclease MutL [Tannerella sp.]